MQFSYKDNQMFRLELVDGNLVSGSTYMIENRGTGKLSVLLQGGDVALGTAVKAADQVWRAEGSVQRVFYIYNK